MSERSGKTWRPVEAMLDRLEPEALGELQRVLEAVLHVPATAVEKRRHELEPLREMLAESGRTRLPRVEYERRRPPQAPTAERLVRRHGSWANACRAARGLEDEDRGPGEGEAEERGRGEQRRRGRRPWPNPTRGRRRPAAYSREEVIRAVLRCAAAIMRIPTSSAYYAWVARERARARERGAETPRLPTQRSVERHFPSWDAVREAVIAWTGSPRQRHEHARPSGPRPRPAAGHRGGRSAGPWG